MFGTFRKHSKWLWMVIIVAIIITFVFWGAQGPQSGGGGGNVNLGAINGEVVTPLKFDNARREVYLRYFLNSGEWPDTGARQTGFDANRETYYRLLLIQKQEEMGVHVSSESVAKLANGVLRSVNRGNLLPLAEFEQNVLRQRGMTVADFERFLRHELGIQQLISVAGLGGKLITPQEARSLYAREHQELSVQAVFFSATNYLADISTPPEAVSQFYSNQMARYRLPERVQVSYVRFGLSNYLAEATQQFSELTNLNEIVEAQYERLGTNFFLEAKTPEEKKEKIREVLFKNQMLLNARRAANEFGRILFDLAPVLPENLNTLAQSSNLTVEVTQPFERSEGPSDMIVGEDFAKTAFELTPQDPFAGPLIGDDGVYMIAMKQRLPSENPPFESIQERVTSDYKFIQAAQQARQMGQAFHATLTNGLASGKNFTVVCAESGLRPVMPPPLAISTRSLPEVENHVNLYQFKQAVFTTQPGEASVFTPTADGGFIAYVQSKLPLDEVKLNAELPNFLSSLRQARQGESFNDWFRREAERALRDIPMFQAPPQMGGPPAG
ncbi:MAG: SurA N-terminal domain-containing protein [Verrucomicrobia bacterium]|nr:SurA N-terminal domain-containing protein [Verrucomicrobiota bacterium]